MSWAQSSLAGTATDSFEVTITIQAGCEISAPSDLNFGTHSFLDTAVQQTVNFDIRCSNGTIGIIALDAGTGASGSVATRTLETLTDSINYSLYTNNSYSTIWGDGQSGTQTVQHTGTGSTTALTIYGQVPVQATPPTGNYSDTITITVTF